MIEYSWLTDQHVPLWAFLLALLTRPAAWSGYARKAITSRYGTQT